MTEQDMAALTDDKGAPEEEFVTIYLVRHGETEWNKADILQGQLDSPLTERGEAQARELGKLFEEVEIDRIITSDLPRASRTAEIAFLERELAAVTSKLLRERNWGEYDGKKADLFRKEARELIQEFERLSQEERWRFKFSDTIESNEEVFGRVMTFLREVAVAYPGETIVVVSHLNVLETLLVHLGERVRHVANTACVCLRTDGVTIEVEGITGVELAESGSGRVTGYSPCVTLEGE